MTEKKPRKVVHLILSWCELDKTRGPKREGKEGIQSKQKEKKDNDFLLNIGDERQMVCESA